MTVDNFDRKYRGMTAEKIIEQLEKQYKKDDEAMEAIERAKKNIAYMRKKKDHKGQTPEQHALELAGNLLYWG